MKRICLILLIVLLIPCQGLASDDYGTGYYIENYDVNINVTDENAYLVTERISVYFTEVSHGIFRTIPYKVSMDSNEGMKKYNIKISDVSVSEQYQTYKENGNFVIKIGSADDTITGPFSYIIKYKYTIGNDFVKGADYLYYDIIGGMWETGIDKAGFTVTMPRELESENFWVRAGKEDSPVDVQYSAGGREITGTAVNLKPYDAVTVYAELPEGYFGRAVTADIGGIITLILSLLVLAIIALKFKKYGFDKRVPPTVEFSSPDDLDSAAVGFIADNSADTKDIISLIFYWADKGILTIEDGKEIILHKTGELEADAPGYQKAVFSGIFKKGNDIKLSSLNESFYVTMEAAKSSLKDNYYNQINDNKSVGAMAMAGFLALVPIIFTGLRALPDFYYMIPFGIGAVLILISMVWLNSVRARWRITSPAGGVAQAIAASLFALLGAVITFISGRYVLADPYGLMVSAPIAALLSIPFVVFMGRRTAYGERIYARILGFRNFMMKAEKNRLELLIRENPSYFYNVLPYAYSLNVTNEWAKKFEGIAVEPPTWYYGSRLDTFTTLYLIHSLNRAASSMNTNMTSRPQQNPGGFKTGGGFGGGGVGGGFGGGGGGRW